MKRRKCPVYRGGVLIAILYMCGDCVYVAWDTWMCGESWLAIKDL